VSADADLRAALARESLDWIVPRWSAPARVRALVTTRNGGVSAPPYATMNVGVASPPRARGDSADAVAENRRRVRRFLPGEPIWMSQVHGTSVARVDAGAAASIVADAATTRAPGIVCAVQVADCMPVLLADRDGGGVAIAHAGWRGLAAGVVEAAVDAMDVDPRDVVAWLGPAIGPRAFEVGADVYTAFCDGDPQASAAFARVNDAKWLADLHALARRRLRRIGVRSIDADARCTLSEPERFFSFRRDGETGRMAALIWIDR
jgi:YfiH family protein